ncbi:hypothetical protein PVBG_05576 [Plasmodium vivax Brazil I]|uniref:Uncharacterized protein n=1 Tax=Plasmodium vivax (strain Brazil I) TaxID=1033975 RepID=A0A0J9SKE0_PLAV1|nr:hypothetical protein PVBG_05576 [Plasmodium vivax Brazil I]
MCSILGPNQESVYFYIFLKIKYIYYSLFKYFHRYEYVKKAKSAETAAASSNAENKCKSFMVTHGSHFTAEETAKTICEQYINLYNSLNGIECNLNSNPKNNKCSKFLKYWINFKLMKSMKNEDKCVSTIYNALESQITGSGGFNIDLVFEEDINKDDLNKMNILYNLYEKYTDLYNILSDISSVNKQSLLSLSNECCTHYIEARYICHPSKNNNDSQFCRELNIFEPKYKELYTNVDKLEPEVSVNFIRLSECRNNKIVANALIGSTVGIIPLLGILYKVSELNIKLLILYGYQ